MNASAEPEKQTQYKPNSKPIKPNTNPIPERPKMNENLFATKVYENITTFRLEQNKPNQTQFLKIPDNLGSQFSISNWISSTSALIVAALYYYRTKTRYIKLSFCVKVKLPAQKHRFF